MEIHFYPLDFEYRLHGGRVYLCLYGRLDSGGKICVLHPYEPYFYVRIQGNDEALLQAQLHHLSGAGNVTGTSPVAGAGHLAGTGNTPADSGVRAIHNAYESHAPHIIRWEKTEKELLGKKEAFYKVYTDVPKAVPVLSRQLEDSGAECHERDILFTHRYLRDNAIIPMTLVRAEGEFLPPEKASPDWTSDKSLPLFLASGVRQESNEAVSKVRLLALDIETYSLRREIEPKKNPILMAGLYGVDERGNEFKKVITWKRFAHKLDYLEHVRDEVQLLQRLRDAINSYRPDILAGYFSDGFDLPYIMERAKKHNVPFTIGAEHSEPIISSYSSGKSAFRTGESKVRGMLHIDVLQFIRNIFGKDLKTDTYSLDAVSEELLGHRKHKVNLDELSQSWDSQPEKLPDFCAYNLHDAHLTAKLCLKLLPDMIEFTKIVGLPLFDVIRMKFSRLVESYILKRAMEFNVLAPNRPSSSAIERRREESIQGAFVLQPGPGLYKDIVVFDFRSLYPTIITAHNIGPEGFQCDCCKSQAKVRVPEKPAYWFCSREKKFLPSVLEELILRRADLKRLIKEQKEKGADTKMLEARSYALKILANSFYGYLGFYGARWYCLECAASTTAYGRNYIKKTIEKAEEEGFKIVYGDTDSLMVVLGNKIIDQAMEFMNEINFSLPGYMELEFEGHYPSGIFVPVKHSEKGAKKKYALMDEKGRVKIVGFESVRRNWSKIAKQVQEQVLQYVLQGQHTEALAYVRTVVQELKKGLVPLPQLVIRMQITRDLKKYSTYGPHVSIARKLQARGEDISPGTVVEYIIAKGTGLVRDRAKLPMEVKEGEYDAVYYINHQLIPAVSSIFAALGYKEDEIFRESSQAGLGGFM